MLHPTADAHLDSGLDHKGALFQLDYSVILLEPCRITVTMNVSASKSIILPRILIITALLSELNVLTSRNIIAYWFIRHKTNRITLSHIATKVEDCL